MWEKISDKLKNGKIPPEYKGLIKETCPVCGKPRIANDNLTEVKCVDYYCIKYVKERAKFMFDYLNISGIGPETSELYLKKFQVKSHMDLLPKVLNQKPSLYLWEIAKIACIPGLSDKMKDIFQGYNRFEDYFAEESNIPPKLLAFKSKLIKYQDYFKIKACLNKNAITIMITGPVSGYRNKNAYIDGLNSLFGSIIRTDMKKTVKAKFVVTEYPNSNTEKLKMARRSKIPVITPDEYRIYLLYKVNPNNPSLARVAKELERRY